MGLTAPIDLDVNSIPRILMPPCPKRAYVRFHSVLYLQLLIVGDSLPEKTAWRYPHNSNFSERPSSKFDRSINCHQHLLSQSYPVRCIAGTSGVESSL